MAPVPPTRKKPFPDVRTSPVAAPPGPSSPPSKVAVAPPVASAPSQGEIARAAYLRWQKLGGDPVSNWLAAEAELKAAARRTL